MKKNFIGIDLAKPNTKDRSVFCIVQYDTERGAFSMLEPNGVLEGTTSAEIENEIEQIKRIFRAEEFTFQPAVKLLAQNVKFKKTDNDDFVGGEIGGVGID